jgi:hypothetical protein
MRTNLLIATLVLAASTAFAQLDPYTLTVATTRQIGSPPDQASLSVYVNADAKLGLSDILNLVQGVGLTQANFSSVYDLTNVAFNNGQLPVVGGLEWQFSLSIPFAGLKDVLVNLSALQLKLSRQANGPTLLFSVNGTQVSPQAQASQSCPTSAMVADARAQAQVLAQAAGFGLGAISTITDAGSGGVGTVGAAPGAAYGTAYSISQTLVGISTFYNLPSPILSCTIVVKFKLTLS